MTVKELKDIIKDLPDDMEVGGSGHFGEKLDCYSAQTMKVDSINVLRSRFTGVKPKMETILCIDIESAGPDPE